jgi:UDP-3-O-[3-hydroxymyristoyl] glucosamine N-acyltransferase
MKFAVSQILSCLEEGGVDFLFHGDTAVPINAIVSTERSEPGTLTFYKGNDLDVIAKALSRKGIVICPNSLRGLIATNIEQAIFVDDPALAACLIGRMFKPRNSGGVHPTATIASSAIIHPTASIGANVYVGSSVCIGENTIIEEAATLKDCRIGKNCLIQPGVRIGSSGLGSSKDRFGRWHHFTHWGLVIIGNDVVIQDNSVIARGSLGDTVIEDGVAIGPLVEIAHNCHIEANVFVAPSTTIAGSVRVETGAIIWGGVSIRDGLTIGAGSEVGMGSTVVRSVPANSKVFGNPAALR